MKKFRVAFEGLAKAFSDRSVQIQLGLGGLAAAAGAVLQLTLTEWMLVVVCIGTVIAAEILNTCIERLADFVQPHQDPAIKIIKDMASAAVLVLSIMALVIGVLIGLNHLI